GTAHAGRPLPPPPELCNQPPRRPVRPQLERPRIADHDRAPGELERGPSTLELKPDPPAGANPPPRAPDQAAERLRQPHLTRAVAAIRLARREIDRADHAVPTHDRPLDDMAQAMQG